MARKKFAMRACPICGEIRSAEDYLPTSSPFFVDGHLTICIDCLTEMIEDENDWYAFDRICQWADWPFLPEDWTRICSGAGKQGIKQYALMFQSKNYQGKVNWDEQNRAWLELQERQQLDKAHPEVEMAKYEEIAKKWKGKYVPEDLDYLEAMLNDLNVMYSISPGLQTDQAIKLCKISLLMDNLIREGKEVHNLMKGYKEIIAIGGFESKNAKNAEDFETVAELYGWLEKTGYENKFYDDVDKDIVDKTMRNIQSWNRRLIMNETNIQDQAQDKKRAFDLAKQQESDLDMDLYDMAGYDIDAQQPLVADYVDEALDDEAPETFDAGAE